MRVNEARACEGERAGVGELADLGGNLQRDAPFAQHDRRECKAHAELLEFDGDVAVAIAPDRDRELTAGEKFCGFARNRREVWLGQRMHQSDPFQRLQLDSQIVLIE